MDFFPQLSQTSPTTFSGYAVVKGRTIPLFISTPSGWQPGRPMHDTRIATTDSCSALLKGILSPFALKLAVIRDLDQLFLELSNLLNQHVEPESTRAVSLDSHHSSTAQLVDDLESCHHYVKSINPGLTHIEFEIPVHLPDTLKNATVVVTVQCLIQPDYPSSPPIFQSFDVPSDTLPPPTVPPSTPTVLTVPWERSNSNRFPTALAHIAQSLSRFAPFWAELTHLARNARLHPSQFTSTHPLAVAWRSIDLGDYAFLELPLSVTHPRDPAVPESHARFVGNPVIAKALQLKWSAQLNLKWKHDMSVVDNIKAVIERELPTLGAEGLGGSGEGNEEDEEAVCAICYEDGSDAPLEIQCICAQQYHAACLRTVYVRQVASVVMGLRMGKCPLCGTSLPVPVQ